MTLKKCSDSKSKVSKVQNSSDIFTLILPQEKWQISSGRLETCLLIRFRPKNNLYLTPRTIGFDGVFFYNIWQKIQAPQLAVKKKHMYRLRKNFCKVEVEGRVSKILKSIKQFIWTSKGQYNFWKKNAFFNLFLEGFSDLIH